MKGKQHDRPKKCLDRKLLVQQQREPEPEGELDDARNGGVEKRVEQGEARDLVAPEELEILEADPDPVAADLGVGEAKIGAEPERIGEKHQQQNRARQHEDEAEHMPVVKCACQCGLLRSHQLSEAKDRTTKTKLRKQLCRHAQSRGQSAD